jgi:radical SAM superfamily enzyme YgiQ (UPF0313 family)
MNKGQNQIKEIDRTIRRCLANGILLSFGLLVGSDGDTNEYLERLPEYLSDLNYFSVTFIGIVCPYPETPFFRSLQQAGRILPGTTIRDYDGYTLCHRPQKLSTSEVVEHYKRLCRTLGTLPNMVRHYWNKMRMSNMPRYKRVVLATGPEVLSISNPVRNNERTYVAGFDPIEEWDQKMIKALQLPLQYLS